MGNYDSPGFSSPLPGAGSGTDRAGTAPGSQGMTYGESDGSLMSVPVTNPFVSVQLPRQTMDVGPGDTSSNSNDQAIPPDNPWFAPPGSERTGAGLGNAGHYVHPNGGPAA